MKTPDRRMCLVPMVALLLAGSAPAEETTEVAGIPVLQEETMPPELRDPFWPVGYVPKKTESEQVVEEEVQEPEESGPIDFSKLTKLEQEIVKSNLQVGGILTGRGGCIAIINKQVTRQGDIITLNVNRKEYRFLVTSLTNTKILLEPANEEETPPEENKGDKDEG